MKFGLLLEV